MSEEQKSIHERIMSARRPPGDGRDLVNDRGPAVAAKCRQLRILLYSGAGLALAIGCGYGAWQFPVFAETVAQITGHAGTGKPNMPTQPAPRGEQRPDTASSAVQADAAAGGDLFTGHANGAGAKACAAVYGALGKALTDGTQFMVQTQSGKTDPDHHALQGLAGMSFKGSQDGGYSGPAAGLVFVAPVAQGCEGNMVRVVPFQQSCEAATALLPKGSQPLQPLSGVPVFELPAGGQAMLLPAGQGCVAISILRAG